MIDHAIQTLGIIVATVLLAYVILWSALQTFNANPSKRFMRIWSKLILYYAAYTMPIWALLLLLGWATKTIPALVDLSLLGVLLPIAALLLYFYTVVIQPNRLRVHPQTIDLGLKTPLTVAVLADLRIGLYSGKPRHIRKLVAKINELSVDAVLINGDWLYYPSADLVGQLMLFKGVNKPIYTVMSISDLRYQSMNTTKQGQPLLEDTLASAFEVLDITYIGQQCRPLASQSTPTSYTPRTHNARQTHTHQDYAHQAPVSTAQPIAMLCGWQDVPKNYILKNQVAKDQDATDQVAKEQIAKSDITNACYKQIDLQTAETKVSESYISKPSEALSEVLADSNITRSDVIVAADKTALCAEINNATQPVIILASRFDNIADLPKAPQPRPLLIAGAAKSAEFKKRLANVASTTNSGQRKILQQKANNNTTVKSIIMTYIGGDKKQGLYQHGSAQAFVSSGIGTRGLPFRLRRPTIDVLTIR